MWQQEFKLVFTAYGAQFEDWGVCATFFRISSSRLVRKELKCQDLKQLVAEEIFHNIFLQWVNI